MMRYQIERTLLRGINGSEGSAVMQTEAMNLHDALTRALLQDSAELVDEVQLQGEEAIAAARRRGDLWLYRVEEVRN